MISVNFEIKNLTSFSLNCWIPGKIETDLIHLNFKDCNLLNNHKPFLFSFQKKSNVLLNISINHSSHFILNSDYPNLNEQDGLIELDGVIFLINIYGKDIFESIPFKWCHLLKNTINSSYIEIKLINYEGINIKSTNKYSRFQSFYYSLVDEFESNDNILLINTFYLPIHFVFLDNPFYLKSYSKIDNRFLLYFEDLKLNNNNTNQFIVNELNQFISKDLFSSCELKISNIVNNMFVLMNLGPKTRLEYLLISYHLLKYLFKRFSYYLQTIKFTKINVSVYLNKTNKNIMLILFDKKLNDGIIYFQSSSFLDDLSGIKKTNNYIRLDDIKHTKNECLLFNKIKSPFVF